jgi:hypothetical protein
MADEPTKQDWAVLDLKPGARPAQVQRAYQRRRALYEREALATYTLLSDAEREQMLQRIDLAYRRIMGQGPASSARPPERGMAPSKEVTQRPLARRPPAVPVERPAPARQVASPPEATVTASPSPAAEPESTAPARETAPQAPEPDPTREPGAYLRYHRQLLSISVQAVADETKIRSLQIEKIEQESYSGLPAAVYVRGFIIQYARFLGLPDPEALAVSFLQGMEKNRSHDPYSPGWL